jgi:hypothetical protein
LDKLCKGLLDELSGCKVASPAAASLARQVSPTAEDEEDEVDRILEELCKELRVSKSTFLRMLVIEGPWLEKRVADHEASLTRLEEAVEWLTHMVKKLEDRVWWILGIILSALLGLLLKLI